MEAKVRGAHLDDATAAVRRRSAGMRRDELARRDGWSAGATHIVLSVALR